MTPTPRPSAAPDPVGERLIPCETFPVGEYLREFMNARRWSAVNLANKLTFDEIDEDARPYECRLRAWHYVVNAILSGQLGLVVDDQTSRALGRAFGCSPMLFARLDTYHRAALAARS